VIRGRTDPNRRPDTSKEQQDVLETYQLGVNSYIVKPVKLEGFVDAVGKLGLFWLLLNQPPR